MTTAVQHRRGTTAEHAVFTGLEGEVTIDTTKDTAVIHDGSLAGGYPLAKESLANVNPGALSAITGSATAADDVFLVYDTSATSMKKITRAELNNAIEADALASVTITGGTINGTSVGASTASSGAFTTLSASGTSTLAAVNASDSVAISYAQPALALIDSVWGAASVIRAGVNNNGTGTGNYQLFNVPTGKGFAFSQNNATSLATLDSSGHLGLGVTPSAWFTGKAFEVGSNGSAFWSVSQTNMHITNNARFGAGASWEYVSTAAASTYNQELGAHKWLNAPSGTAGSAISFTQALTLHASGGLSLGNTSDIGAGNLNVTGRTQSLGGQDNISTGTSATLFTLPTGGVYIVNASFSNFTGGSCIALVWLPKSGNTTYSGAVILGQNSATFTITVSGADVVLSSTIGATATYFWSAIKLY
jgi:hypothetical protein